MRPIDLRSDTVTRPSEGMRRAMAAAEVGDDCYREDPTVNRLQEQMAAVLGKEAALFVPTGTMANEICIGAQVEQGDEIVCEAGAHAYNHEGGALAGLWGAQVRVLEGRRGIFSAAQVQAALRPAADMYPRTRLVEIENTSNRGGGSVWPLETMREIRELCTQRGIALHLDGARLFNAQVASGVKAAEFAALADTVSTCFSKGLGAPVGSVVAGTRDFIAKARRLRRRLGGGMRQAGVLAAAALYALENNVERLADDHRNAKRLAEALAGMRDLFVNPLEVDTNMVFATVQPGDGGLTPDAPGVIAARLREAGVLCGAEGMRVRFVTHLDVSAADVDEAVVRVRRVLA